MRSPNFRFLLAGVSLIGASACAAGGGSIPLQGPGHSAAAANVRKQAVPVAVPTVQKIYQLPATVKNLSGITKDASGNIWFSDNVGDTTGFVTPTTGAAKAFVLGDPKTQTAFTIGISPFGPWVSQVSTNKNPIIDRMATSGILTTYSIPLSITGKAIRGIIEGSDKNMWLTAAAADVLKLSPSGTFITHYSTPTNPSGPRGICTSTDGHLWVTEQSSDKIAELTTAGTFIGEYAFPRTGVMSSSCAQSGTYMYFSEPTAPTPLLGRVSRVTHKVDNIAMPHVCTNLTASPDGNIWCAEFQANKIARYVPGTTPTISEYGIPYKGNPMYVMYGAGNIIWFTEQGTPMAIGKLTF